MTQMSAGQVPGISASGQFRIVSSNRHYAGLSRSSDDSRRQASTTALLAWNQHIVLLQEMAARAGIIAGPPLRGGGGPAPAWCQALIQVPGIGPGMLLADPVYQVAQRAAPDDVVSVSYAGNDPLVLAHARALLTGAPGTAGHIDADLNDPGTLLKADRYPSGRRAVTSCSVI